MFSGRYRKIRFATVLLAVVALLISTTTEASSQRREPGFAGELIQISLGHAATTLPVNAASLAGKPLVRAVAVGANWCCINQAESESFRFWETSERRFAEWEVGFIVANLGDRPVSGRVVIKVGGVIKDTISRDAILQPREVTLFQSSLILGAVPGLYTFKGILKAPSARGAKATNGGLYVERVF